MIAKTMLPNGIILFRTKERTSHEEDHHDDEEVLAPAPSAATPSAEERGKRVVVAPAVRE